MSSTTPHTASPTMPLNRFISLAGLASRRKAVAIITSGQVTVNGALVTNPAHRVTEADCIIVAGEAICSGQRYYIMLNKPRGYSCTAADPYAKRKAIDLIDLPNVRLFSAGRLDKDSEGLIIFSNDGDYIQQLTHPRYGICKTYLVNTTRPLKKSFLQQLVNSGIIDHNEQLRAKQFNCIDLCRYQVVLNEGKKREIRRMVAAGGSQVTRLQRIAVGHLHLGPLPSGKWRELTPDEYRASLQQAPDNSIQFNC